MFWLFWYSSLPSAVRSSLISVNVSEKFQKNYSNPEKMQHWRYLESLGESTFLLIVFNLKHCNEFNRLNKTVLSSFVLDWWLEYFSFQYFCGTPWVKTFLMRDAVRVTNRSMTYNSYCVFPVPIDHIVISLTPPLKIPSFQKPNRYKLWGVWDKLNITDRGNCSGN